MTYHSKMNILTQFTIFSNIIEFLCVANAYNLCIAMGLNGQKFIEFLNKHYLNSKITYLKSVLDELHVAYEDIITDRIENRYIKIYKPPQDRWKQSYYPLTYVTPRIVIFNKLETLTLTHNELTEIPICLSSIPTLTSLNLNNNLITRIPDFISKLTNLEILVLRNNKIGEIPDSLSACRGLRNLDLTYNKISVVPDSLYLLTKLDNLFLAYNQIDKLSDCISELRMLRNLDISHNRLTEVNITKLPRICHVIAVKNSIQGYLKSCYRRETKYKGMKCDF